MKKFLTGILITFLLPSFVFAEDISVSDLLGTDEEVKAEEVAQLEEQRTEEIENELQISIPDYTDNPSHIITFIDPSEEKAGVEIDIDESGYKDITSPYSLPSLSIGEHHLKFRFVDSIGATKVLEYDIVIIPRPPIIKAPQFTDNNLIISGTGLANSEVVLTVSVGADHYTEIAEINGDGDWNTAIEFDTVVDGIYTIYGYTRKDGYASNPSEPAVVQYGDDVTTNINSNSDISFSFNDLDFDNIISIIGQNPDLLILTVSGILFGGLVTALLFLLINKTNRDDHDTEIEKKINGKQKNEKTLLELFGEESNKEVKKPQKEKKKEKRVKKSKKEKKNEDIKEPQKVENEKEAIFTRRDFLKDFKNFDPDKESGKENKEPTDKNKKDVVVTLTSKVEE
ncbi:MAG: hypothetical protein PHP08_01655 [Candidatus Dojkabacteria bacterium]|nr:hypothetical protein [Candidatus Dojkabacteria bacterium]